MEENKNSIIERYEEKIKKLQKECDVDVLIVENSYQQEVDSYTKKLSQLFTEMKELNAKVCFI